MYIKVIAYRLCKSLMKLVKKKLLTKLLIFNDAMTLSLCFIVLVTYYRLKSYKFN